MATLSLRTLAQHLRNIDYCMMVTNQKRGGFNSRPMSNNRDVTYGGDSFFFSDGKTKKVKELEADPNTSLNFEGEDGLFISIAGKAKLIRDKAVFQKHWQPELDRWFKRGIDTPGLVLIHVKGARLRYWQKAKEGEMKL